MSAKGDSKNSTKRHNNVKKEPFDPGGKTGSVNDTTHAPSVERSHSQFSEQHEKVRDTVTRSQSVNSLGKETQSYEIAWTGTPDISITESPNNIPLDKPRRLVLYSSKIKNNTLLMSAALPGVRTVQYKYEGGPTGLEVILKLTKHALAGTKVESIAIIPHTKPGNILLCNNGEKKEVSAIQLNFLIIPVKYLSWFVLLLLSSGKA